MKFFTSSVYGVLLAASSWLAAVAVPVLAGEQGLDDIFEEISSSPSLDSPGLNVRVDGVLNNLGDIVVLVFDDEQAYADYEVTRTAGFAAIKASRGSVEKLFSELARGPYAIFAFHDENNDRTLNEKRGFPMEGYGYSGATDRTTIPSFDQAAITSNQVTIRLVYLHCTMFRPTPACLGRGGN